MTAHVQAAADRWDEAFNGGDTGKLATFYSSDARVVPAGGKPVDGPSAIGAFFADLRAKGFDGHKITVQSVLERDTVLVASGIWALTGPGEGGQQQYSGNWVNVIERRGDDLRVLLHSWN